MVFLIEHTYAKMNSLNELSIDIFHCLPELEKNGPLVSLNLDR